MRVEIDRNSGFCGGVIRAIRQAESFLSQAGNDHLFSLGAIVHNDAELGRLASMGLVAIDYDDLAGASGADGSTILIRAHGEPPAMYQRIREAGFNIIDCTCPVVLDLQKSIREASQNSSLGKSAPQIVIFGQIGHAEVLGLVGQAPGAIVIEDMDMMEEAVSNGTIDLSRPVEIFSQTTKDPARFSEVCSFLKERTGAELTVHNTICTQVAARQTKLAEFAARHDVIVFVSGKSSSNGKVLCSLCKKTNIRTYHIENPSELRNEWFSRDDSIGVCGATSTPRWLLEEVAGKILEFGDKMTNFAPAR